MERIGGGNDIFEPHEGDGADQRAVKRTRAAEHQHDQRFGRKREAETVETDDPGGNGVERTANAGDDARYDEHLQNRAVDGAAHGLNADAVLLDAAAQHAEGRIDHDPEGEEDDKQQTDAVNIGGAAEKIEFEGAEQRVRGDAGKSVAAARPARCLVGSLMEQVDDGDGKNELRKAVGAQENRAGDKSGHAARACADHGHQQRIGNFEMGGGDAGGIGARAEERGMAKRGDAAIAGNEIDRQHEKRNGDDAGQKRQIIRKQVITGNRGGDDEERSRQRAQRRARLRDFCRFSHVVHEHRHLISPFREGRAGTA